jgi:hypothetical protein
MRGNNDQSYVAIDQFEFLASDTCDFEPKEAWPVEPPTTPAPTEPPGRKFFWKIFTMLAILSISL